MVLSGLKTLNTRRDLMVLMSFPLLLPLEDTHIYIYHTQSYSRTIRGPDYTVLVAHMRMCICLQFSYRMMQCISTQLSPRL